MVIFGSSRCQIVDDDAHYELHREEICEEPAVYDNSGLNTDQKSNDDKPLPVRMFLI